MWLILTLPEIGCEMAINHVFNQITEKALIRGKIKKTN